MGDKVYKQIEEFEKDYDKIASKETWEPCDITKMKDLQKLMYYIEVREAMKNGGEYPGSEYMDQNSYARGQMHNPNTGRFMSYRGGGGGGGSGTYPMNGGWYYDDGRSSSRGGGRGSGRNSYDDMRGSGRRYYDDMRGSGRRYYDDGAEDAINKLYKAMEAETNPEYRMAMQEAIRLLEEK